jgi:hypothetical protein
MIARRFKMWTLLGFVAGGAATAQTPFPGVTSAFPCVVERGKTATVRLNANHPLDEAYKVLIGGSGVTGKVAKRGPKDPKNSANVELTVAADADLGPREIRLATKKALTTVALVYVTPLAVTLEADKNDKREFAQPVEIPCIVAGRAEKNVDEDWFRFAGKANEVASFAVLGSRMHGVIHKVGRFVSQFDPVLKLFDDQGREIASNDDYLYADSVLTAKLPKDGDYFLCLREATYKGNEMHTYALAFRRGPQPTHTLPLAVPAGATTTVKLLGPGVPDDASATLQAPQTLGRRYLAARSASGMFAETLVKVGTLPRVEPSKEPMKLPASVSGVVSERGQSRSFAISARKGKWYRFEAFARRLFSPVDADLRLLDDAKRELARSDDHRPPTGGLTKDPQILWQAPRDQTVTLTLRDAMGAGGRDCAYHLEMEEAAPDCDLTCDPQLVMIGPNNRSAVFVRAHRKFGFDGAVDLEIQGLPAGMTASPGRIPAGQQDGCIVLSTTKDAKIDAANLRIRGRIVRRTGGKTETVVRDAVPLAEIYQAQRQPIETMAAAITEPSDIRVETPTERIELRPGGSAKIPVKVVRSDKYKSGPVTLWADWRFGNRVFGNALPPGVTLDPDGSLTSLNGSATEGYITLTASAAAKPTAEPVRTAILAQVTIEFSVSVVYCTAPIEVAVLPEEE